MNIRFMFIGKIMIMHWVWLDKINLHKKGADYMHIGIAVSLFIVSYLIQLWLCLKAKNKHIKLIPLYLCVLGAIYSALLYVEFLGLYRTGSWMQLEAYIYFIILLIIGLALLLAKITHIIAKAIQRRNNRWRKKVS